MVPPAERIRSEDRSHRTEQSFSLGGAQVEHVLLIVRSGKVPRPNMWYLSAPNNKGSKFAKEKQDSMGHGCRSKDPHRI